MANPGAEIMQPTLSLSETDQLLSVLKREFGSDFAKAMVSFENRKQVTQELETARKRVRDAIKKQSAPLSSPISKLLSQYPALILLPPQDDREKLLASGGIASTDPIDIRKALSILRQCQDRISRERFKRQRETQTAIFLAIHRLLEIFRLSEETKTITVDLWKLLRELQKIQLDVRKLRDKALKSFLAGELKKIQLFCETCLIQFLKQEAAASQPEKFPIFNEETGNLQSSTVVYPSRGMWRDQYQQKLLRMKMIQEYRTNLEKEKEKAISASTAEGAVDSESLSLREKEKEISAPTAEGPVDSELLSFYEQALQRSGLYFLRGKNQYVDLHSHQALRILRKVLEDLKPRGLRLRGQYTKEFGTHVQSCIDNLELYESRGYEPMECIYFMLKFLGGESENFLKTLDGLQSELTHTQKKWGQFRELIESLQEEVLVTQPKVAPAASAEAAPTSSAAPAKASPTAVLSDASASSPLLSSEWVTLLDKVRAWENSGRGILGYFQNEGVLWDVIQCVRKAAYQQVHPTQAPIKAPIEAPLLDALKLLLPKIARSELTDFQLTSPLPDISLACDLIAAMDDQIAIQALAKIGVAYTHKQLALRFKGDGSFDLEFLHNASMLCQQPDFPAKEQLACLVRTRCLTIAKRAKDALSSTSKEFSDFTNPQFSQALRQAIEVSRYFDEQGNLLLANPAMYQVRKLAFAEPMEPGAPASASSGEVHYTLPQAIREANCRFQEHIAKLQESINSRQEELRRLLRLQEQVVLDREALVGLIQKDRAFPESTREELWEKVNSLRTHSNGLAEKAPLDVSAIDSHLKTLRELNETVRKISNTQEALKPIADRSSTFITEMETQRNALTARAAACRQAETTAQEKLQLLQLRLEQLSNSVNEVREPIESQQGESIGQRIQAIQDQKAPAEFALKIITEAILALNDFKASLFKERFLQAIVDPKEQVADFKTKFLEAFSQSNEAMSVASQIQELRVAIEKYLSEINALIPQAERNSPDYQSLSTLQDDLKSIRESLDKKEKEKNASLQSLSEGQERQWAIWEHVKKAEEEVSKPLSDFVRNDDLGLDFREQQKQFHITRQAERSMRYECYFEALEDLRGSLKQPDSKASQDLLQKQKGILTQWFEEARQRLSNVDFLSITVQAAGGARQLVDGINADPVTYTASEVRVAEFKDLLEREFKWIWALYRYRSDDSIIQQDSALHEQYLLYQARVVRALLGYLDVSGGEKNPEDDRLKKPWREIRTSMLDHFLLELQQLNTSGLIRERGVASAPWQNYAVELLRKIEEIKKRKKRSGLSAEEVEKIFRQEVQEVGEIINKIETRQPPFLETEKILIVEKILRDLPYELFERLKDFKVQCEGHEAHKIREQVSPSAPGAERASSPPPSVAASGQGSSPAASASRSFPSAEPSEKGSPAASASRSFPSAAGSEQSSPAASASSSLPSAEASGQSSPAASSPAASSLPAAEGRTLSESEFEAVKQSFASGAAPEAPEAEISPEAKTAFFIKCLQRVREQVLDKIDFFQEPSEPSNFTVESMAKNLRYLVSEGDSWLQSQRVRIEQDFDLRREYEVYQAHLKRVIVMYLDSIQDDPRDASKNSRLNKIWSDRTLFNSVIRVKGPVDQIEDAKLINTQTEEKKQVRWQERVTKLDVGRKTSSRENVGSIISSVKAIIDGEGFSEAEQVLIVGKILRELRFIGRDITEKQRQRGQKSPKNLDKELSKVRALIEPLTTLYTDCVKREEDKITTQQALKNPENISAKILSDNAKRLSARMTVESISPEDRQAIFDGFSSLVIQAAREQNITLEKGVFHLGERDQENLAKSLVVTQLNVLKDQIRAQLVGYAFSVKENTGYSPLVFPGLAQAARRIARLLGEEDWIAKRSFFARVRKEHAQNIQEDILIILGKGHPRFIELKEAVRTREKTVREAEERIEKASKRMTPLKKGRAEAAEVSTETPSELSAAKTALTKAHEELSAANAALSEARRGWVEALFPDTDEEKAISTVGEWVEAHKQKLINIAREKDPFHFTRIDMEDERVRQAISGAICEIFQWTPKEVLALLLSLKKMKWDDVSFLWLNIVNSFPVATSKSIADFHKRVEDRVQQINEEDYLRDLTEKIEVVAKKLAASQEEIRGDGRCYYQRCDYADSNGATPADYTVLTDRSWFQINSIPGLAGFLKTISLTRFVAGSKDANPFNGYEICCRDSFQERVEAFVSKFKLDKAKDVFSTEIAKFSSEQKLMLLAVVKAIWNEIYDDYYSHHAKDDPRVPILTDFRQFLVDAEKAITQQVLGECPELVRSEEAVPGSAAPSSPEAGPADFPATPPRPEVSAGITGIRGGLFSLSPRQPSGPFTEPRPAPPQQPSGPFTEQRLGPGGRR